MGVFNFEMDFSPEAELQREIAKRKLEALRSGSMSVDDVQSGSRQRARYEDTNRQRDEAWAGMTALDELRKGIINEERNSNYIESVLPATTAQDPKRALELQMELRLSKDRAEELRSIEKIKKAETYFRLIDSSRAPSMTAQYVAEMLGMKKPNTKDGDDFVEVSQETYGTDGAKTTRKWREKAGSGEMPDMAEAPELSVRSQPSSYQSAFNDYQTGSMPSVDPSGYSSGFGNTGAGTYLAGSGGTYDQSGMIQPTPTSMPVQNAKPQADTEAIRQQALQAMSQARTPEQRQKIKDRAAQYGVVLP